MHLVLVVDNDYAARTGLALLLQLEGFSTITAVNAAAALEQARLRHPDVVLTEVTLPDMAGTDICHSLRELDDRVVVMFTTCLRPDEVQGAPGLRGPHAVFVKPIDFAEVLSAIRARLGDRPVTGAQLAPSPAT